MGKASNKVVKEKKKQNKSQLQQSNNFNHTKNTNIHQPTFLSDKINKVEFYPLGFSVQLLSGLKAFSCFFTEFVRR
jgi:hypothetical protein